MARFKDIHLEILVADRPPSSPGVVPATFKVLNSPVGEWTGATEIPVLTFEELDVLEDGVQAPDDPSQATGDLAGRAFAAAHGQRLFDATIGRWGKLAWARDKVRDQGMDGVRLRIRSDSPIVSAQPWELLYSVEDAAFLALQNDISVVRESVRVGVSPTSTFPVPLRVLLVGAAPTDLLPIAVAQELAALEGLLREFGDTVEVHTIVPATFEAARMTLRNDGPWHVVHFAGHGYFDPSVGSMVMFEKPDRTKDPIGGEALAAAISGRSETRLVVVNACRGSMGEARGIVNPLARTLMGQGLPAVIAMQFEVTDTAAVPFAVAFYRMLIATSDVEEALSEARTTVSLTPLYDDDAPVEWGALRCLEWCTPVLHLDAESGLLFDQTAESLRAPVAQALDDVLSPTLRSSDIRIRQVERLKWELSFAAYGRSIEELAGAVEQVLRDTLEVRTLDRSDGRITAKVGGALGAFLPAGLGATEVVDVAVRSAGRINQVQITSKSWQTLLDQGRNEANIRKLAERMGDLAV